MKSCFIVLLAIACIPLPLRSETGPEGDESFSHSVTTQEKPWTKRDFRNDPNDFQFYGMLDEDVATEAHQRFWRGLKFTENFRETYPFKDRVVTLPLENPFKGPVSGRLSWLLPSSDHWTVSPRRAVVELGPGETREIQFTVNHEGDVSTYMEMAIPLQELGADPASQTNWGMQMVRHRPRMEERKSYQWAPTFWYGNFVPSLFGRLEFQ